MNENEVMENSAEVATETASTVVETVSKTSFWQKNGKTAVGVGIAALCCIAVYDHVAKPIYKACKKAFSKKKKEEIIDAEDVKVTDAEEEDFSEVDEKPEE